MAEREPAAREAAAAIPVVERAPQRRGNRPGPGPDLQEVSVLSCQAKSAGRTPPAGAIISSNALATFPLKSASIW